MEVDHVPTRERHVLVKCFDFGCRACRERAAECILGDIGATPAAGSRTLACLLFAKHGMSAIMGPLLQACCNSKATLKGRCFMSGAGRSMVSHF